MARVRGRRHRARAGAPVALPARGVSECAAQRRDGPGPLVPGARRRRGGDVRDGDGTARGGGVRAVRDFQRGAARTAARHNVKYWSDGEWLGFGCGAHSTRRGCPVEECRVHRGVRPAAGAGAKSPAIDHRPLSPEERLGDALFTGLRLTAGRKSRRDSCEYGVDVWARYGPRARTVPSGRAARAGGSADVADASGNASCS